LLTTYAAHTDEHVKKNSNMTRQQSKTTLAARLTKLSTTRNRVLSYQVKVCVECLLGWSESQVYTETFHTM